MTGRAAKDRIRRGIGRRAILTALGVFAALALALALSSCAGPEKPGAPAGRAAVRVRTGLEVFLEKRLDLVRGKRVGLITNPTGTDAELRSTVDLFRAEPAIDLVALYGPEHGVRGNAQAGEYVPFYYDETYQLPVFSLYGQSFKPEPGMLKDIDEYMRRHDTQKAGKVAEGAPVQGIDVLVFDIQDAGTRVYTYIATMATAMQAAAEAGIDFIVLDRPVPINGLDMEGAVLEYPAFSSFIGLYPVPLRFGMTIGELARLFNDKFLNPKARLTVVSMEGWKRSMWFDETGLPWVIPSPNLPTLDTATVYPGLVALEGTNLSEGRGTTRPFEFFGAPWIDGHALVARLNGLGLAGVRFREAWFTPWFSKFQGELCGGCQIHVTDRSAFRSVAAVLHIIKTVREMYPDKFAFHGEYFDKVMGTDAVRKALEAGSDVAAIVAGWQAGLDAFAALREPYLLY
jgi:uncharacterized protein YbbC (DUF1343 family)